MNATTLPGSAPLSEDLTTRIERAVAARAPAHGGHGAPKFTNRLALETSPYLLQHAHNPVAWWPWCDEAFEEARRTGRPVFLSVGYSTCHWCHVMERESFEDEEIAAFLNAHYVPIKVDREERPDVDAVYMTAVQALTGGGGWPMSVFLDADREPFFGGTYFPARDGDRGPSRGFLSILQEISAVWQKDRGRVANAASALGNAVRVALASAPEGVPAAVPGTTATDRAVRYLQAVFDPVHGGVNRAPKFPSNIPVRLLLRHHRRTGQRASLDMAALTLERMAAGGMMDQVGGGFHRYSTDERWLVPHFEKMLYDNALLAVAYLEGWQATGRPDFARVARQTLDYVLREMVSPEGAFYSATDADSEGEEGRFFVWEEHEVRRILGPDARAFAEYYGITPGGNFEGRNIPWVQEPDEGTWASLASARARLYDERERRPPPLRDEKILAAWNGLMISAMAVGGRVLSEPRYTDAARRAAAFALANMRPGGRLARTYMDGKAGPPGFLQDHAFLARGLLDLHQATLEPEWLFEASALCEAVEARFADPRGAWFVAGDDQERLIAREKPTQDGAEPSGASYAVMNALQLEALTGEARWGKVADDALRWYAPTLEGQPIALTELLLAVEARAGGLREVVLVWPAGSSPETLLEPLRRSFTPNHVLTGAEEGRAIERLGEVAKIAEGRVPVDGKPTAYVCERGACQLPVTAPEALERQLSGHHP